MRDIYEFNHIDRITTRNILDMKSCTAVFEEKILFVIFQLAN